jgi:nucleotide-binding universal stress UspA family protein
MFHRILVGVDDTPAARRALERAIELATAGHGRIGILASAPQPPLLIATSPVVPPAGRSQLCEEMVEWAQRCVEEATALVPDEIPVTKLVACGEPCAALRDEAEKGCWDLIVVGQSARRHRFRNSVGARLDRHATPVLVVHEEPQAPPPRKPRRFTLRRRSRRASAPVVAKGT